MDVIGLAQEALHSMEIKKKKVVVLKLELKKAYHCVKWDFLWLVLLQIGLSLHLVNWIMGCVSSSSFVVLINGSPTKFFKSSRGLRQGFPMSSLLFILLMEGLSLALHKETGEGFISGIGVDQITKMIHILFVDDVLILNTRNFEEWKAIQKILLLFFCAV